MTRKHHPQVWCNYIFQGSHQLKKHSALINGSMYMYINITMSKYFEFSNSKEMDFSLLIYIKLILVPNIIQPNISRMSEKNSMQKIFRNFKTIHKKKPD